MRLIYFTGTVFVCDGQLSRKHPPRWLNRLHDNLSDKRGSNCCILAVRYSCPVDHALEYSYGEYSDLRENQTRELQVKITRILTRHVLRDILKRDRPHNHRSLGGFACPGFIMIRNTGVRCKQLVLQLHYHIANLSTTLSANLNTNPYNMMGTFINYVRTKR